MSGTIALILAGGEGTRLMPLTAYRAKPAVPFAGSYRLIDFVLNNFVNSGIIRIYVITQYKSQSLYKHLQNGWSVSGIPNCFIDPIPAQMRTGRDWYKGTADAIYQNLDFITEHYPDEVCVFGSDHIYKMDVRQLITFHHHRHADLCVAALRMPASKCAGAFGIIETDEEGRVTGFEEKPAHPREIPGAPGFCLVSMGNYVFNAAILSETLVEDAHDPDSSHDFGHDIIPHLYPHARVFAYDLTRNHIEGEHDNIYWRDVGSVDAYWEAHMDLLSTAAPFKLGNRHWPLHTFYPPLPPAHFSDTAANRASVSQSLISAGCDIEGASINKSVLGFRCSAGDGSQVEETVLIGDIIVGDRCRIRRAIVDRKVQFAPGFTLGYDRQADRRLVAQYRPSGLRISQNGIIVIPQGIKLGS